VYQLRPLLFSLSLNNPPRTVGILYSKSRAAKRYEALNRGALDVKWRELEFRLLLNSALKYVPQTVAIHGVWTADCHEQNTYTADCHRQKYKFESGLPQAWPDRMYSWQPERGALQSAVHLRAVCQGVIPVVAIRGILLQSLANEWIPVPAILHRQFPGLLCNTFLTCDFLGVRQIHGGLFRPKLYTNDYSWQTISWYYPFKRIEFFLLSFTSFRKLIRQFTDN
jgi:hypothetical protein